MSGSSENIQVLGNFRPLLNILTIYHSKDYRDSNHRIVHICQRFGFSLMLLGTSISIITNAWFCVDQEFDLNVVAQPISFWISSVQMIFVYITIVPKSVRIEMIINRLRAIVRKRKLYQIICCCCSGNCTLRIQFFEFVCK